MMVEVTQYLSFAPEGFQELAALFSVAAVVIARAAVVSLRVEVSAHLLDRNRGIVTLGVLGLIDGPHATSAYHAEDAVAPAQHIADR